MNPEVADLSFLIADCGHPHWPGWQVLAYLLLVATICAVFAQAPTPRTFRPPSPAPRARWCGWSAPPAW